MENKREKSCADRIYDRLKDQAEFFTACMNADDLENVLIGEHTPCEKCDETGYTQVYDPGLEEWPYSDECPACDGVGHMDDGETINLYEHGLSFDFVEPNTYGGQPVGYYCYLLSWGGPSDEFRFYPDGRIEYCFKDWFDGAVRDVTRKPWAQWLHDWFAESGHLDWSCVEAYDYSQMDMDDE